MTNFKVIITSFKQQGFGNYTAIGLIKAAIEVYGSNGVFTQENTDTFKLKNGKSLIITEEELRLAQKNCGFVEMDTPHELKKDIIAYANKCFAIICKSKQLIEEYKTYQEAIDDINNGESAYEAPEYLGLERLIKTISYAECKKIGAVVAHSPRHAVYVSHGYYGDYGNLNLLNRMDWVKYGRRLYRLLPA